MDDDGMLITVVLVHKGLNFQHGFSNPPTKTSLWSSGFPLLFMSQLPNPPKEQGGVRYLGVAQL
jgi:hypothetical protein